MSRNIKVGDKIKLNYDLKEFDLNKYFDGSPAYSFSSVQLNIPKPNSKYEVTADAFLPIYAPIIFSSYEEEILNITLEDQRKIGYTKSFKIDLSKAIEEDEITINSPSKNTQKHRLIFEDLLNNLLEHNENYIIGLITKLERKNSFIDCFQYFYRRIFKDELEELAIAETKLSDEEFFSKSWKRYVSQDDHKQIINNVTFIWSASPIGMGWRRKFILDGIKKGVYKKVNLGISFGGIHISKRKTGIVNLLDSFLTISISEKSQPSTLMDINDLAFDDLLYDSILYVNGVIEEVKEIKDIWEHKVFLKMLKKVIESPTC